MPGIFGIIGKKTIGDESIMLDIMCKTMMHEQFYTASTYTNEQIGCYIGGISIKGSFTDCMPIYNKTRDHVLFLSGECYSDADTISELKSKGYGAVSEKADYIINLYEERGDDFITILNGWFNGILVDTRLKRVILFNDRYGIKRIYYHETDNAFYFSSEAKALLKVLPQLRSFDSESLGQYFTYDCVLDFRTLFHGIFVLPPAAFWDISSNGINKRKYFDVSIWENQESLPINNFYTALNNAFLNVLPRYFFGDNIGMALTGGLDTRLILACACPTPGSLPCYTFRSMYNTSLDCRIARKVAKTIGQEHYSLKLDEKFLTSFPYHAARSIYITDGLADIVKTDEIYMNNLSREISPVKMTGKFGSQVIRHLSLLKDRSPNEQLVNADFRKYVIQGKRNFEKDVNGNWLSFMLFTEIPLYWAGFTTSESSQLTVRSPYLDNEFIKCLYMAPKDLTKGPQRDFQWDLIAKFSPQLFAIRTDKGIKGKPVPIFDSIIKMSYQTFNYMDLVYNSEKLPYSLHKRVHRLDKLFSFIHPEKIVAGYCNFRHYRHWFQTILSGYLKEILLDEKTLKRQHFNPDYIKKTVIDHVEGKGNYLTDIRKVLTIELVNRVLIEDI